uniref:NADH-ubiquinone oxidoreductase chain 2 n=1 Tax=Berthellina sp. TLT-2006 TaxID=407122 RepID=E6Y143_9GAST|nr:NADH dehydrogenase subunit 2 [Berthellina sp. TLT-2006]ABK92229.1 NADH dehydrogenase subunit 2 [Berthellina sp. TLT-2006]
MSSANLLFLLMVFFGPLVTISSSNWLICWIGIELGFIGLIPLLFFGGTYYSLNKECVLKYFCVQAFSSALLFLGGLVMYECYSEGSFDEDVLLFGFLMFCSLVLKLGGYPGHFWVLGVVSGLEWMPLLLLLAWQKVAPFSIMVNLLENNSWLHSLALLVGGFSSLVGSLIGLNQTNFRAVLGASSISHTGWALIGSVYGSFWLYFGLYCFSFLTLILFLGLNNYFMSSLSVLSLSGLPPFILFIGKWKVLLAAISSGCHFLFLVLPLLGAFISLFFYLKFLYSFYLSDEFGKLSSSMY